MQSHTSFFFSFNLRTELHCSFFSVGDTSGSVPRSTNTKTSKRARPTSAKERNAEHKENKTKERKWRWSLRQGFNRHLG
jgi:hypothetical protein